MINYPTVISSSLFSTLSSMEHTLLVGFSKSIKNDNSSNNQDDG